MTEGTDSAIDAPWAIPASWQWSRMGEVSTVIAGGTPSTLDSANYEGGTIPWITPADLSGYSEKTISSGARSITQRGLDNSGAQFIPKGSVLFSSRAPIGYVAVAGCQVTTNQGFKSFDLGPALTSDYVYYYLLRAKELAVKSASGTTFLELSKKKAESLPVPIAPLPEQRRIVKAIEANFARLDAGLVALEQARTSLSHYREVVLREACGGLLFSSRTTATTLGEIADIQGGITLGKKRAQGERLRSVPYLRVANVQRGSLDLSEVKSVMATEEEINRLRLVSGDVLFNEGGDRDKLGRGWVWENQLPECIHQNHVFRARIDPFVAVPKFISYYGNSVAQRYFWEEGKHTTNMASINRTSLAALPVQLPTLQTQHEIVAEADRLLSMADAASVEIRAASARARHLRESILGTAFEGRLAPQDPRDEPASALLERIKAERPRPAPRNR